MSSSIAFNQRPLDNQQLYFLLLILGFSAFPHFFHLSIFVALFFGFVLLVRTFAVYNKRTAVSNWLIYGFLVIGLINVVVQNNGVIGKDFGVSLLVSMLALKTLELKNYRDAYVILFLTCFLLITQFLYNQNIIFSLYLFSLTFFILVFLLWLNQTHSHFNLTSYSKIIGKLSLQALPIMLLLFVLFPRLNGPLWGFDKNVNIAVTGISGQITPGSISKLSQSSATAFRVTFDSPDDLPASNQRYWRGPVMVETDGISWHSNKDPEPAEIKYQSSGAPVHYQITMEASRRHWLFALDLPATLPSNTFVTSEYSVRTDKEINTRSTFSFSSYPNYQATNESTKNLNLALNLPNNITPRMSDFAKKIRSQSNNTSEYSTAILNFFNRENFIYTLSPPALLTNPTDQFLFDSRKGFCEHYATSFVILMRLGGVPARVVSGYQGGEWNPTGEHLIVRQSDAHAWAEIWLDDNGWTRIDPTSAVAPERVEQSIDPIEFENGSPVVYKLSSDGIVANFLREAAWMADSLDLNWHKWVVGFSKKRQQQFLNLSGLDFLKGYKLGFAAIFSSLFFVVILFFFLKKQPKEKREPAKIYWDKFCKKLSKKGVLWNKEDGPKTISYKAKKHLPDRSISIDLITQLYIKVRYSNKGNSLLFNELKKLISSF